MRNINELPECPVATTISLVGNKWKLLIIRNLTKRMNLMFFLSLIISRYKLIFNHFHLAG